MEDWIVQSVDYNQADGKVDIGVQATRVYGVGSPMSAKNANKFMDYAKSIGLVGPSASLENWDKYAWVYPLGNSQASSSLAGNPQSSRGYGDVVDY
jgi:hypothetical protein